MGLEDARLRGDEPIADIFSLTKEMERDLPLDKFKTADDYLKELKKFYGFKVTNKQGREIEPLRAFTQFVEQVEKALVAARDKAAKAAKAARGSNWLSAFSAPSQVLAAGSGGSAFPPGS